MILLSVHVATIGDARTAPWSDSPTGCRHQCLHDQPAQPNSRLSDATPHRQPTFHSGRWLHSHVDSPDPSHVPSTDRLRVLSPDPYHVQIPQL